MAKIIVQNTQITVIKQNEDDYISLTDMLKAKDGEFFFSNWLRNRNTIEFLGIWERLMNPNFNCAEFDIIKSQAGLNLPKSGQRRLMPSVLSQRQGVMVALTPTRTLPLSLPCG